MTGLAACTLRRRAPISIRPVHDLGASSHKLGRAFALASKRMNVFIGSLVLLQSRLVQAIDDSGRIGRITEQATVFLDFEERIEPLHLLCLAGCSVQSTSLPVCRGQNDVAVYIIGTAAKTTFQDIDRIGVATLEVIG